MKEQPAAPILKVYPKFRPGARWHINRAFGECLEGFHHALIVTDLDQPAAVGELISVRNKFTGTVSNKYLLDYNGRRILASLHPPAPLWDGLEIMGPVVATLTYPGAWGKIASDEQAFIDAEWAQSSSRGYGTAWWFMQVLGPRAPVRGSTSKQHRLLRSRIR